MYRQKRPWYRWQFNLATTLFAMLFGWLAWDSLTDASISMTTRIADLILFGGLALVFVWQLWRGRQRHGFKTGSPS